MSGRKLGILGGTFDPIHIGHLKMAQAVYEKMGLEKVIFIPAFIAPHKVGMDFAPACDRYNMTVLATKPYPHFSVSDMELKRSGVSYTYDTLKALQALYPDCGLYFIIGADSVSQLHSWNRIGELLEMAVFVAAGRPGYNGAARTDICSLDSRCRSRILMLDTPEYNISSTEIRTRVRNSQNLAGLVPEAVEEYIREKHLYADMKENTDR